MNIQVNIDLLRNKDANVAYKALKELIIQSEETSEVSEYFDLFVEMMNDKNSYIRMRGLRCIAYNAKWIELNKLNACIDEYLRHFEDEKPIIARGCIQDCVLIAKAHPELADKIVLALKTINHIYQESMQSLIYCDRKNAIQKIEQWD